MRQATLVFTTFGLVESSERSRPPMTEGVCRGYDNGASNASRIASSQPAIPGEIIAFAAVSVANLEDKIERRLRGPPEVSEARLAEHLLQTRLSGLRAEHHLAVVVHSMGSTNAIRFAIEYPDRAALGLMLVATFASYRNNPVVTEFWESSVSNFSDPIEPADVPRFVAATATRMPVTAH